LSQRKLQALKFPSDIRQPAKNLCVFNRGYITFLGGLTDASNHEKLFQNPREISRKSNKENSDAHSQAAVERRFIIVSG
jgi:hypothetical protein